jgi:chaperonin GroES
VLTLSKYLTLDDAAIKAPNLCDRFSNDDLTRIGQLVKAGYERDRDSRITWERRMQSGLSLAMQVAAAKDFPWPKCSNVIFPLVTIAALQFSARAYANIIQGDSVVQYRTIGPDPDGKQREHADRVGKHMSYQVLEEDTAWEEQHDRLLINVAIIGSSFIKTYYSASLKHNVSELVMAQDFVLDYYAKSVEECARKTQILRLYRNDIYEKAKTGIFNDVLDEAWFRQPATPLAPPQSRETDQRKGMDPPPPDDDTPFPFLEQHRNLDLDGDGYDEPYIITAEANTGRVVRIVSRVDRDSDIERSRGEILRITPTEYFTKYSFIPSPDGGIYDIGFGSLLGPLNESVNSAINQLLDGGTMQNSMGGFLGRGTKIRGGSFTMAPWEWKRVDSTGDDLRKNMVPFPERQISPVTLQLLMLLIEYTDRISNTTETQVGENPGQNTPAETTRTMSRNGARIHNAIFKRVWRSMKEEFKKLHRLNAMFLPARMNYGTNQIVLAEDYRASSSDRVIPTADPDIMSEETKVQQAAFLADRAHMVPGYNPELTERGLLAAMKIPNVDNVYPGPQKTGPLPNPKIQVQQSKEQMHDKTLSFKKSELAYKLMAQSKINNAQIAKLYAEVQQIMATIGIEQGRHELEKLQVQIDAIQHHNEMINERVGMLLEGNQHEAELEARRSEGMAAGPGNGQAAGAAP